MGAEDQKPKAHVTFYKEIQVTVIGDSVEEIRRAAKRVAADGSIDSWAGAEEWDVSVAEIRLDKFMTAERRTRIRCDMGVIDGKLVDISDYEIYPGRNRAG